MKLTLRWPFLSKLCSQTGHLNGLLLDVGGREWDFFLADDLDPCRRELWDEVCGMDGTMDGES